MKFVYTLTVKPDAKRYKLKRYVGTRSASFDAFPSREDAIRAFIEEDRYFKKERKWTETKFGIDTRDFKDLNESKRFEKACVDLLKNGKFPNIKNWDHLACCSQHSKKGSISISRTRIYHAKVKK